MEASTRSAPMPRARSWAHGSAAATRRGVGVRWGISGRRYGKLLVAVIHDREMAAALGVDVRSVFLVTFTLGTVLAALGGALTAPTVSVVPGMGVETIVLAFAVV